MSESKFLKAYCAKAHKYYGIEVKKYGSTWKVVNVDSLDPDEAKVVTSSVRQSSFETNTNLLPCSTCGSRKVGGCSCPPKKCTCKKGLDYNFECIYCNNLVIDYSLPRPADFARFDGDTITVQGKEVKLITFSNVSWQRFDNITSHVDGKPYYPAEPVHHVIASEQSIEFHGYNISEMNEGVYYTIDMKDDFEIECDVDTTQIKPHPGGCFYVDFGLIKASITQNGGSFFIDGVAVANVGAKFKMRLSLTEGGKFAVFIGGKLVGEKTASVQGDVHIIFGFKHDAHHCELLSHAYLSGINMVQSSSVQ